MPSVAQVSRPSSLTALTMSQTRSRSLSFGLRHAAAMQNRLAPASLARRAVSMTASPIHQLRGFNAGVVMRALRAVPAIFRAAAGLDAEQARGLDVIGIEIAAMKGLRLKDQVYERQIIKCLGFGSRPVVARLRGQIVTAVERNRCCIHVAIPAVAAFRGKLVFETAVRAARRYHGMPRISNDVTLCYRRPSRFMNMNSARSTYSRMAPSGYWESKATIASARRLGLAAQGVRIT